MRSDDRSAAGRGGLKRPAGEHAMQWTVGKVTITKVVEPEMAGGSRFLLPQATPETERRAAAMRAAI